jgi:hypothetical protein
LQDNAIEDETDFPTPKQKVGRLKLAKGEEKAIKGDIKPNLTQNLATQSTSATPLDGAMIRHSNVKKIVGGKTHTTLKTTRDGKKTIK